MAEAKKGDRVSIIYEGKLTSGEIFDQTKKDDPLIFEIGSPRILPAFQEEIIGMKEGEKKNFTIPAVRAYGNERADLFRDIPRERLQNPDQVKEGNFLQFELEKGEILTVPITKVTEETVTVNLNHPLAGEDLNFSVELLKIG